jgi:hypothetical protein
MTIVGGGAVVGVDGQVFSKEHSTGIVGCDRQRVGRRGSRRRRRAPGRPGSATFEIRPLGGRRMTRERRRAHRNFDSVSLVVRNRWPPRSHLHDRIGGKDHRGIRFRTRALPRREHLTWKPRRPWFAATTGRKHVGSWGRRRGWDR